MNKPQSKRFTAIIIVRESDRYISFECTEQAYADIVQFLRNPLPTDADDTHHSCFVSSLYDFNEVVEYIRNWTSPDLSVFEDAIDSDVSNSQSAHE